MSSLPFCENTTDVLFPGGGGDLNSLWSALNQSSREQPLDKSSADKNVGGINGKSRDLYVQYVHPGCKGKGAFSMSRSFWKLTLDANILGPEEEVF